MKFKIGRVHGEHHFALWCLAVSSMKLFLLVLSAVMSIKAVQGCTNEAGCVFSLGLAGCNRPNTTRDLKTAFLDIVNRIDRAIPELGLMSNGPRFAPSRERSMEKPDICENCA